MIRILFIAIGFFYSGVSFGQENFEFDSIKFNTYNHPAVHEIYLVEDSIKFYSVRTGWEAWIHTNKYKGITIQNDVPNSAWLRLKQLSKQFIFGPAKKEVATMTHSHKSRLEWYNNDTLVYFATCYPGMLKDKTLKEIYDVIMQQIKQPNNQLWLASETCNYSFLKEIDSISIKLFPNKKEIRQPYDVKARDRYENIAVINNENSLSEITNIITRGEKVNPYLENIFDNLYQNENYYTFEFFHENKNTKLYFYNNYLRTSSLCWTKVNLADLLKK